MKTAERSADASSPACTHYLKPLMGLVCFSCVVQATLLGQPKGSKVGLFMTSVRPVTRLWGLNCISFKMIAIVFLVVLVVLVVLLLSTLSYRLTNQVNWCANML